MPEGQRAEKEFPKGISIKRNPGGLDWINHKMSIKIDDAIEFLQAEKAKGEEWINLDVATNKEGTNEYLEVNRWKPDGSKSASRPAKPAADAPPTVKEEDLAW